MTKINICSNVFQEAGVLVIFDTWCLFCLNYFTYYFLHTFTYSILPTFLFTLERNVFVKCCIHATLEYENYILYFFNITSGNSFCFVRNKYMTFLLWYNTACWLKLLLQQGKVFFYPCVM